MKKFVVFLIVGLLASSAAWGATSAGITIEANVAQILDVSPDPLTTWEFGIDNSGNAAEFQNVGTLTVKSSTETYIVTFSSANGGMLKKNETDNPISYNVKAGLTSAYAQWTGIYNNALDTYVQLSAPKTILFSQKTPKDGVEFNISFNIEAYTEFYVDGVYTDTITISIAQN
ncbi:MAG: hypothetical protein ABFC65_09295 [Rectinema sp.]